MRILLFAFCLLMVEGKAQIFSSGNLTVYLSKTGGHDTERCQSVTDWEIIFVKQNSFLNDTVIIKSQNGFMTSFPFINLSGTSVFTDSMAVSVVQYDYLLSLTNPDTIVNWLSYFAGSPFKAISSPDTVYNIDGSDTIVATSPCSGDVITGKVYADFNNDCAFNGQDLPLDNIGVVSYSYYLPPTVGAYGRQDWTGTNFSGDFLSLTQKTYLTHDSLSIPPYFQFIFPPQSCSPVYYNINSLPYLNANFALQCTSLVDLRTDMCPNVPAVRPNIPFILSVDAANTGCDSISGVLKLVIDGRVTYDSIQSSNPAQWTNGDTLFWNFTKLTNLSNGSYWNSFTSGVYLTSNVTVNIGDTLCFTSMVNIPSNDIYPANNIDSICIPVINSFDPNEKLVLPAGSGMLGQIPVNTQDLMYTIYFQNTGTAPALNIIVSDTISDNIDSTSIHIIATSHYMEPEWSAVSKRQINFKFNFINLPDSTSNEPQSHGFVKYSCKLKPGLQAGDQIRNTGYIFFDWNPAVVTNTTLNTLQNSNSISDLRSTRGVVIFPNPAADEVIVALSHGTIGQRISLWSVDGQSLFEKKIVSEAERIDISTLSPGIYFVKVGGVTAKLVKN